MEPCGIAKLTAFPLQRGLRQSPNFYVAYPWHSSVTSQSQHGTFVSIVSSQLDRYRAIAEVYGRPPAAWNWTSGRR